eukprot:CAMPEP_0178475586 /NCGR_PEP_ID=MMETSP0696-20121128/3193_1 /TAXON_ID=265572 /ORGANISM="Extubocellulus spinifer, Strain CCMP396" /LENGTH=542 /DNA_ID=CAMNT_0020102873 /DNA_START=109 /DNA_END=1737 /DNA_ORIENTATION=+
MAASIIMRRAIIEMAALTLLLACASQPYLTSAAFLLPSSTRRSVPSKFPTISRNGNRKHPPSKTSSAEYVASLTRGGAVVIDRRQHQQLQSSVALPIPAPTAPPAPAIKRGGAQQKQASKGAESHGASMAASIFNLVNNVAGAGILTLAAGKAAGTGWIPSVAIVCFLGWAASTTFRLIAKACELTGENDFKGIWSKTLGSDTKYLVDLFILFQCFASTVVYSGILGDVWTPIFKSVGMPDSINRRKSNIVALATLVLYPLSLIKDLSALAFTSILGFSAVAYTVFFIIVRSLDGTYALSALGEPLGKFVSDGSILLPSFAKSTLWNLDFTSLVLMSSLGLAFIAHYNAPTFFRGMEKPTIPRFGKMVKTSYLILAAIYCLAMNCGYATFGDVCKGNILLNYHSSDILAVAARVATGFSILFGFPLVFRGARLALSSVMATLGFKDFEEGKHHTALVTAMLTAITSIAITVEDVSLVVGLSGATMGSLLVYILPPIMYTKAVNMAKGADSLEYKKERLNLAFIPLGLFIAGMGVFMTLKSRA